MPRLKPSIKATTYRDPPSSGSQTHNQPAARPPRCGPLRAAAAAALHATDELTVCSEPDEERPAREPAPHAAAGGDEDLRPRTWYVLVQPSTGLFRTLACPNGAEADPSDTLERQLSSAPKGSYLEYMGVGEAGLRAARTSIRERAAAFSEERATQCQPSAPAEAAVDDPLMDKCASAYTCAQEAAARLGEAIRGAQGSRRPAEQGPPAPHFRARGATLYLLVAGSFAVLFIAALLGSPHRQQAVGVAIGLIAGGIVAEWASSARNAGLDALIGRLHRLSQGHEMLLIMFLLLVYHVVCTRAAVVQDAAFEGASKASSQAGWPAYLVATITGVITTTLLRLRPSPPSVTKVSEHIELTPDGAADHDASCLYEPILHPASQRDGGRASQRLQWGFVYANGAEPGHSKVIYVNDAGNTMRFAGNCNVHLIMACAHRTLKRGDVISFYEFEVTGTGGTASYLVPTCINIESSLPTVMAAQRSALPSLANWAGGGGSHPVQRGKPVDTDAPHKSYSDVVKAWAPSDAPSATRSRRLSRSQWRAEEQQRHLMRQERAAKHPYKAGHQPVDPWFGIEPVAAF